MLSVDGEDSIEDDFIVVIEYLFVIFFDCNYNYYSVYEVGFFVVGYFNEINCLVMVMYKFIDGCSV